MPWQEQMGTIGRALGRSDKAAEVVADVGARIAGEREANPAFAGLTVVLAGGVAGGSFGVFGAQDPKVRLLTELGFTSPEAIDRATGKEHYGEISRERLRLIDEDVLIFVGDPGLRDDPLFRRLDVVREQRTVNLDEDDAAYPALNFNTPLSIPFVLDTLVPRLAAAATGNGATPSSP